MIGSSCWIQFWEWLAYDSPEETGPGILPGPFLLKLISNGDRVLRGTRPDNRARMPED